MPAPPSLPHSRRKGELLFSLLFVWGQVDEVRGFWEGGESSSIVTTSVGTYRECPFLPPSPSSSSGRMAVVKFSSFPLLSSFSFFFFLACTPPVSSYPTSSHSFDLSFQTSSLPCLFQETELPFLFGSFLRAPGRPRSLEGFGG